MNQNTIERASTHVAIVLGLAALTGCSSQFQATGPNKVVSNQHPRISSDAGLTVVPGSQTQSGRDCNNRQTFVDDCSGFARYDGAR